MPIALPSGTKRWRGDALPTVCGSPYGTGHATVSAFCVLAVAVPALLPAPAPFKVFVLLSGVTKMGFPVFTGAVAMGAKFGASDKAHLGCGMETRNSSFCGHTGHGWLRWWGCWHSRLALAWS